MFPRYFSGEIMNWPSGSLATVLRNFKTVAIITGI